MLSEAQNIVETLPPNESGKAVLDRQGVPYRQEPGTLQVDLRENAVAFHKGRIGGVWPTFRNEQPQRRTCL